MTLFTRPYAIEIIDIFTSAYLDRIPIDPNDRDLAPSVHHLLRTVVVVLAERLKVARVVKQVKVALMRATMVDYRCCGHLLGDQAELAERLHA